MKTSKIISVFVIILFSSISLLSENKPDSLINLYKSKEPNSLERATLSSKIASFYINKNDDSAKYYSQPGLEYGIKNRLPALIIENAIIFGKIMINKDSMNKAAMVFDTALYYAENFDNKTELLRLYMLSGYVYDKTSQFIKARKSYLSGIKLAKEINDKARLWSFYNNMANHLTELESYDSAVSYLYKSIKVYKLLDASERKFPLASVYSNLGLSYLNNENYDSAIYYFNKVLNEPELKGNHFGLTLVNLNLGYANSLLGNNQQALKYLLTGQKELDSLEQVYVGPLIEFNIDFQTELGKVYFNIKNYQLAENYLLEAILKSESAKIGSFLDPEVFDILSKIYDHFGNSSKALEFSRLYSVKLDEENKRKFDSDLVKLDYNFQIQQQKLKATNDIELANLNKKKNEQVLWLIIILALLMILLLFSFILLQRSKLKRKSIEQERLQLENNNSILALEYKNKELTTNVMYLAKKNEFISVISKRLNELKDSLKEENKDKIGQIINELDRASKDNSWKEFEVLFMQVNSDFYDSLNKNFTNLNSNDIRLCAFIKLNMTNKEISALTFQSVDSIKMARHRLRKKMNIESGANLNAYLNRL